MSINRRTAIAVRSLGVVSAAAALALGVADSAFACNINDFTTSVSCDTTSGQGVVHVTDVDTSHTSATVTVFQGAQQVGSGRFENPAVADSIDITVPWTSGSTYRVHVKTDQNLVDKDITGGATAAVGACTATKPAPSPSTSSPSAPSASAPATTPAASPTSTSSSAAAVADTNAPSPAAGGGQGLAETGGGSNTGMIVGVAGVLVVLGGGAVFAVRRRGAAARH